jgi:hypothetical protein
MGAYTSNLDQVAEAIRRKVLGFGFDSPSSKGGGTVGDRAAKTLADDIHERSKRGDGPDGAWDRNAPSTIARKGRDQPNINTGQMIAPENIAGTVTNTGEECRIEYTHDEEIRARAEYANSKGQGRQKIIRRFMALDDTIKRDVVVGVREDLGDHLSRD